MKGTMWQANLNFHTSYIKSCYIQSSQDNLYAAITILVRDTRVPYNAILFVVYIIFLSTPQGNCKHSISIYAAVTNYNYGLSNLIMLFMNF